eukprot:15336838-Ditylum_brightwellii.AAC.1
MDNPTCLPTKYTNPKRTSRRCTKISTTLMPPVKQFFIKQPKPQTMIPTLKFTMTTKKKDYYTNQDRPPDELEKKCQTSIRDPFHLPA